MYVFYIFILRRFYNNYLTTGGTLYHASILINSGFSDIHHQIYVIDGQNITQINDYKQLNNTDAWNPCIPMPFSGTKYMYINITFINNIYNNFRDWYPLEICDYPDNFKKYKNEFLFDGRTAVALVINNLNINNYIINGNRNYPIAILRDFIPGDRHLYIDDGTFINISSETRDPLFYGNTQLYSALNDCLFSNISVETIFYRPVNVFFVYNYIFQSWSSEYVHVLIHWLI